MTRELHPASKAAAAAKYASAVTNPLSPLAQQVGKALAREVTVLSHMPAKTAKGSTGPARTVAQYSSTVFETRITLLVTEVLERSLSSRTAEGKALRMALIAKLANAEAGGVEAPVVAQAAGADALLTTAEAAAQLEVSRPYVSMLCDSGKLGQVVTTEGGHRRIRASAVQAYLAARTTQHEGAVSPRQAGVDAGLYEHPDTDVKVVRRAVAASKAAPAKAARKRRE